MNTRLRAAAVALVLAATPPLSAAEPALEIPASSLSGRTMAQVREEFAKSRERSDAHRFVGATYELLGGVEVLCQRFHALGLNYGLGRDLPVPFLRLAIPPNPDPKPARAEDVRAALEEFYGCLSRVDEALGRLGGGGFQAVVPLSAVSLDFDGNGAVTEGEAFAGFFARLSGRPMGAAPGAAPAPGGADEGAFVVAFDPSDALWLRAYTHMLRGLIDLFLAHDGGELFQACGHLFFVRAVTPLGAALVPAPAGRGRMDSGRIADAIAMIHTLVLPVQDPKRLARVRTHLLAMVELSRKTLDAVAAETDNDREWLPGPSQQSVFGLGLAADQAEGWRRMLGELESLLEGRTLLPHWRFTDGRGLNLRRLLTESRETDLVLLIQGSAAVPYMESGALTSGQTWREIMRLFRGNFLGYALWIN